ncbi:unnamed protein product [Amoebophrya sp. A25]|nr:unnamed protein product [Amoebophrya sp. A25]|eukprot:GSA25T00018440001.1
MEDAGSEDASTSSNLEHREPDESARCKMLARLLKERSDAAKLVMKSARPLEGYLIIRGKVIQPENVGYNFSARDVLILDEKYLRTFYGNMDLSEYLQLRSETLPAPDVRCKHSPAPRQRCEEQRITLCPKKGTHWVERRIFKAYALAEQNLLRFFKPKSVYTSFIVVSLHVGFCPKCLEEENRPKNSPFLALPGDVMFKISSYLEMSEAFALSRTCSALRIDLRTPWEQAFANQKKEDERASEMKIWRKT